jgi:predicted ATPase/DNA-binding CsgD family transcriptional regulator
MIGKRLGHEGVLAMDELIGREREQAVLTEAIAAAASGAGGVVLVAGEAGVGKTCVVRAALGATDMRVLAGSTGPGGASPYGPIVAALRTYVRAVPDGLREAGPLAAHLALLLPELGPPPPQSDLPTLVEALRCALVAIGRTQPVAVFLDDLHWADAASLELLPALAGGLAGEPVVLVGAYRSDDLPRGHALRRVRTELRREGRLREVVVEPLDLTGTGALASRILGGAVGSRLATLLYHRTQGVPFFVEELAAALVDSGRLTHGPGGWALADAGEVPIPDTLRDAVLLRADGLSDAGREALEVAAVMGLDIDLDLIEKLVGTGMGLTELIERGLLSEGSPGQAVFRHALAREAIYGEVPWPQRRTLHRTIATELAVRGTAPAIIAEHWLAGREFEQGRRALLAAADASCAVHAYRDAARALQRALELWPEDGAEVERLAALDQLGACAQRAGDLAGAARAWQEAAAGFRATGDLAVVAETERRLAGVLELQGHWDRAIETRQAAIAAFAAAGKSADAAAERLTLAAHLQGAGQFHDALPLLVTAKEEAAQAARTDLLARTLGLEGSIRAKLGEVEAGLALVRRGLSLALEHDLTGPAAEIYTRLAGVLEHAADYRGAQEAFQEAYAFCEARNLAGEAQVCLACLGNMLWLTGEWDRTISICEELRTAPDAPTSNAATFAAELLGHVYAARGEGKRARPFLLESLAWAKRSEYASTEFGCIWMLARVDLQQGAVESAVTRSLAALTRWAETEERHYAVPYVRWSATFFAEQGRAADVAACANALARIAAETGNPEVLAALSHALGEAALLDGDAAQAVDHFSRALELLRPIDVPFEHAQIQVRAGVALAALGEREAAVERLTEAYRTANRLGARPLAEEAVRRLVDLGEHVERRLGRRAAGQQERAGLTRRELEVVRLVALGRTNREIGQELFLSARTVEMHVGNVLAKLDCRTRTEATHKAEQLGLLSHHEIRA